MTNTNYHIAFDRMFARGATFEIDAAFSNPAGLAWGHEGWQLSFNWQSPRQDRDITTSFPLLQPMYGNPTHTFNGKATAPFVPALFASYKHDRWAVSTMIGIVGSGGFVEYKEGVPMFNVLLASMLASNGITPDQYKLDSQMKGKQYIYGGQLNFTYRLLDCLSAAVAAKYEFRTKLNIPNTTNTLSAGLGGKLQQVLMNTNPAVLQTIATTLDTKTTAYKDGEKTRYDMPALLSVAAGYEFTPNLRASVEYHFFDDKHAKMSDDRQDKLTHGTHEVLAGVEYDINKTFTVSVGGQHTDYGLSDDYQTHTSFACDSYSVGFGGAVNLNEHLRLNLSYFVTLYDDYKKDVPSYLGTGQAGTDTFSRTNNVFGVGIDYKF